MPIYGPKIIGDAAYKQAVHVEQATVNSVYGSRVQNVVADEVIVAPEVVSDETVPAVETPPQDAPYSREDMEAATLRIASVVGEGYAVSDASLMLAQAPDFWLDIALAEMLRSETVGVRKGIVKLLREAEVEGRDEVLLALLTELAG